MGTKLAYLAGLFDGEGHVGIIERRQRPTRRFPNPQYDAILIVANTDPRVPNLFKKHFGCGYITHYRRHLNWRTSWTWRTSGYHCANILKAIYPYLMVKKEQAKHVITRYNIKPVERHRKNPPALLEIYKKIRAKIMELNHRELKKGSD